MATEPDTSSRHPRKVAAGELSDPGVTSTVVRLQAFADEKVWVGAVINSPREMSRWHVHPGQDTCAYIAEGSFRVEYGPGGREAVELGPGDFAHIPGGIVHREGNPGDSPNKGIAFRIGDGPLVVTWTARSRVAAGAIILPGSGHAERPGEDAGRRVDRDAGECGWALLQGEEQEMSGGSSIPHCGRRSSAT